MPVTKDQHLDPARAPKRILSLDGGGIRGFLTLQYLEAIEALLRQRTGRADLVLSDYFDLIGGTSTGGDPGGDTRLRTVGIPARSSRPTSATTSY